MTIDHDFLNAHPDPAPQPSNPELRKVTVRPGQSPPRVDPEKESLWLVGSGPFRFQNYQGTEKARILIQAQDTLQGNVRGEGCGILLDDGCANLTLQGIRATENLHGIRFRGSKNIWLDHCLSWANAIEGFVWGACHDNEVFYCKSWNNGRVSGDLQYAQHTRFWEMVVEECQKRAARGLPPKVLATGRVHRPSDRSHGFYPGFHSSGIAFHFCESWGNTGLGWHVNGTQDEPGPPFLSLTLDGCKSMDNGSGGSGNLDLNYLHGAKIIRCLFANGNGCLSTWDDGANNPRDGADGIAVIQSTLVQTNPKANHFVRLESGGEVRFSDSILLSAGREATADRTSHLSMGENCREYIGSEYQSKLQEWLDPTTLASKVVGVGWPG